MNRIARSCRYLGTLAMVFLLFPTFAYAALININTADATLLDTLPGIGPTYATRIVDYRTANGPFAHIEDIQNVSGIGPSTYADIAPLITVGDTSTPDASTASSTQDTQSSSGSGATTYTVPPSALSLEVGGNRNALVGVPLSLSARALVKGGGVDSSARIMWGFGDGSASEGSVVEKTYRYAGTYLVTAIATDGPTSARGELVITAKLAKVRLLPVSGDGITVANDSDDRLDLSGWRLTSDKGSFRIPSGTVLLSGANVLFPFTVIHLPVSLEAALLYPDGIIAAHSAAPALSAEEVAQPFVPEARYEKIQTVDSIINPEPNFQAYEEARLAPTAAVEPAAVGAVAVSPDAGTAGAANARVPELLRSPWTLGLFGVMVLAGAAFILL